MSDPSDSLADRRHRARLAYVRASAEEAYGVSLESVIRDSDTRRFIVRILFAPTTEWSIMALILLSVALLVVEVSSDSTAPVGWLGSIARRQGGGVFLYIDLGVTLIFAVEYLLKLWLAPRKGFFFTRHIIDLLAILPILRVFRIGRAMKLLRLFRLLRVMRVGGLLASRLNAWSADVRKHTAENLIISIYFLFSVVFGTVGILVFEKGADSGFDTFGDGLWWCLVTITTVGYGDKFPVTGGGRAVATLLMFIGLSFYALLTGLLSTILIERSRREEGRGMDITTLRDHIVVCSYNPQAPRLIEDLLAARPGSHVVLVTERDDVEPPPGAHVHLVRLDPTSPEALDASRVEEASVVVVMADDRPGRSSHDADARSILTVLAVERRRREVHTIVELRHAENAVHARNANVDEIVVSGAYTGTMLSYAVQFPGVSAVFSNLFEPGSGSVIAQEPLSSSDVGRPFAELAGRLLADGQGAVLGYKRGEVVKLAPPSTTALMAGDALIVVRAVRNPLDF